MSATEFNCGGDSTTRPARRLVCVGQLSVDTIVLLDRPIPLGDQTSGQFSHTLGGSAAITAHNAAVLGAAVCFAGFAGGAPEDAAALVQFVALGVDVTHVRLGEGLRVTVLVEPGGERTMISNNVSCDWDSVPLVVSEADVVYFEGWPLFDPVVRAGYVRLIEAAASLGATTALDVCSASRGSALEHRRLLAQLPVSLLFANEAEATHYRLLDTSLEAVLVVHRGADATIVVNDDGVSQVAAERTEPLDSTGAGDTFAAGFLTAVAAGACLLDAVDRGHDAARRVLHTVGPLLHPPATIEASLTAAGRSVI